MIIELDGEVHMNANSQEYDQNRTEYLESLGFTVMRFENKMVFENLASVLQKVEENFKST